MPTRLLHENTREGTDLDFSIFKEHIPTYFNFTNTKYMSNKAISRLASSYSNNNPNDDYIESKAFVFNPNENCIPDFWKKYIPNEFCFHVHNYCQVSLIEHGKILYFVNNRPIEVGESELIIINANIPHTWLAVENTSIIMAAYYPKLVFKRYVDKYSDAQLDLMYSGQFPYILLKSSNRQKTNFSKIFSSIYTESISKNIASDVITRMKLFEFSILIIRNFLNLPQVSNYANNYSTLQKAFDFILNNLKENISLNEIAKYVNMNASYFSHYFKVNTGVSLITYINNQRLTLSAKYLLESKLPVTDIAFECGFSSISTFYQLFKSKYSLSPLKFRKLVKTNVSYPIPDKTFIL